MKQLFLILVTVLTCLQAMAQLNCKTTKSGENTVIACYHLNKKPSTIESWDKERRTGSMKGFDASGKELFSHSLRSFAGHASVYLNYYPNGQVKKAEYRSAPDGGIQFWQTITEFDENGKQTAFYDLSQPDGHPSVHYTLPGKEPEKPVVTQPAQKPAECATPMMTVFRIKNRTAMTVRVLLKTTPGSQYVGQRETMFVLKPMESLNADSILMANQFMTTQNAYHFEVAKTQNTSKKLEVSEATPAQTSAQRKVLTWIVTEE